VTWQPPWVTTRIYYIVARVHPDPNFLPAKIAGGSVYGEAGGDSGLLKLQTSSWGSGDFDVYFVHCWHWDWGGPRRNCGKPITNTVSFHIP